MDIIEFLKNNILFLDGGMGTMLMKRGMTGGQSSESWNLSRPDDVTEIHAEYYAAGSDAVSCNTFGVNGIKYTPDEARKLVRAATENAKKAKSLFIRRSPSW